MRDLVVSDRVSLVCVQETKMVVIPPDIILSMLGSGFDYAFLPADGPERGILVAWRTDVWSHYRRRLLPRVPNALGEGPKTLGEAFPECNTRGRASGDASHGKEAFPECQKSYTRGSLPRVSSSPSGTI
jgi:hypothetical protein